MVTPPSENYAHFWMLQLKRNLDKLVCSQGGEDSWKPCHVMDHCGSKVYFALKGYGQKGTEE